MSDVVAQAKAALEGTVIGSWEHLHKTSVLATLVPELVAEIERLRAQYAEVRLEAERLRYDNRGGKDV